MLSALTLLLVCQLAGEALKHFTGLPLPGSVVGMGLLLIWLGLFRKARPSLAQVTGWLTAHMPIMFVPAAVGLVTEGEVLSRYGLAIVIAGVVSTVATMAITAVVFNWAVRRFAPAETLLRADEVADV